MNIVDLEILREDLIKATGIPRSFLGNNTIYNLIRLRIPIKTSYELITDLNTSDLYVYNIYLERMTDRLFFQFYCKHPSYKYILFIFNIRTFYNSDMIIFNCDFTPPGHENNIELNLSNNSNLRKELLDIFGKYPELTYV